jgi:hypothetical protein
MATPAEQRRFLQKYGPQLQKAAAVVKTKAPVSNVVPAKAQAAVAQGQAVHSETGKAHALSAALRHRDVAKVVDLIGGSAARELAHHLERASAAAKVWRRRNPGTVRSRPRVSMSRVPRRGHVGPRSRPAIRRRTTASSASSRGDPDLGDEAPGYRPPSQPGAAA